MKNLPPLIVTDAEVAEVVSTTLYVQSRITGYVHLTVRLAPGITQEEFAHWYNRGEIVYESIVFEDDTVGEITRNGEVIGTYEVGDLQYDVGAYPGEPEGERVFNIQDFVF